MLRFPRRRAAVAAVVLAAGMAAVLACGPNFPNRLLLSGDAAVLSAPSLEFKREIERFVPAGPPRLRAVHPEPGEGEQKQSARVDLADLRAAMGAAAERSGDLLDRYGAVRVWVGVGMGMGVGGGDRRVGEAPAVPDGLPAEFQAYINGLAAFRVAHAAEARGDWLRLLEMPAQQRRWRSVWAAFMLGKSYLGEDPAKALGWFGRTRELAQERFSDNLGLAAASLGWEARAELELGHLTRAVELYLEQLATGDGTALMSLRLVGVRIASGDLEGLEALARHLPTQRVVTAYVVSRGGPTISSPKPLSREFASAWLAALEKSGAADVTSADRIAWAAYQGGDFAGADRWLRLASPRAALGQWLRAKLLLRAGKLDQGAALLAEASRSFPEDEAWDRMGAWASDEMEDRPGIGCDRPGRMALGESGVVLLARRQYTEALDALLRAGFWTDAAYVAERVLEVDELKTYVDRAGPATKAGVPGGDGWYFGRATPEEIGAQIRWLLGRRLARLGRFEEAGAYMAAGYREKLAELAAHLRDGHDRKRDAGARASALWEAAKLMRAEGMELVGTEMGPDAAIYGGSAAWLATDAEERERRATGPLVRAAEDELDRVAAHRPDPNTRFHYRFVAARLAWAAAELMPDQDPRTAEVLCTAGGWLKIQDVAEADRFYKTLVRRCGKTALGAEADRVRWFPKEAENKE
jgi:hypothetical protein